MGSVKSIAVLLFLAGTAAISATYFAVDRYRANILAQKTAELVADMGDVKELVASQPEHRSAGIRMADGQSSTGTAARRNDVMIIGVPDGPVPDVSENSEILELVLELAERGATETWSDFSTDEGADRLTVVEPITASDQDCVSCHNQISDETSPVEMGDVLGAAVVDVPVAVDLGGLRKLAILVGVAGAATVLVAGGLLVWAGWKSRRDRKRETVRTTTTRNSEEDTGGEFAVFEVHSTPFEVSREERFGWLKFRGMFRHWRKKRRPVADGGSKQDGEDSPTEAKENLVPPEVTGRVLIVDPDQASGRRVKGALASDGIVGLPVTSVVDAGMAAERMTVDDEVIDCVVVAQDPKASHHQKAIEFIRKYEPFRNTPIVFVDTSDQTVIGVHTATGGFQKSKGGRKRLLDEIMGLIELAREGRTAIGGQVAAKKVEPAPKEKPEKPKPEKDGIDVLVCEDDEVNRLLMTTVLKKMGLTHVVAKRRADAVRFYQKRNPGIVIVDVTSARLGGLQAVAEIRRAEKNGSGRVPILGVSTETGDQVREKCRKFGIDDLLSKPVRFEEMQTMITHWKNV